MSKKQPLDRRALRTRSAIRQAFIDLIQEQGFEALSVKDLTTRANINRGTFYLHYRDKYDLLEQIETEIIQDVEQIFQRAGPLELQDLVDREEPLEFVVELFQYLESNAPFMQAILQQKGDFAFRIRIKEAMERNLFEQGVFNHIRRENLPVPGKYFLSYLLSAHLGVVEMWLQEDCRESPQEIARILTKLSFGGPFKAIVWKPD